MCNSFGGNGGGGRGFWNRTLKSKSCLLVLCGIKSCFYTNDLS